MQKGDAINTLLECLHSVVKYRKKRKHTCDLEHLLVESIRGQLIADVPLGLFLSSGVDSSLLTAIINKHFKDIPYNFSRLRLIDRPIPMKAIRLLNFKRI
ncbi:MAG: hypothetical protein IPJ20_00510 [Flammeovirgaceae bacterium]|nr:hypothetical protein [Flammeovirgaceae bacterium]